MLDAPSYKNIPNYILN